MLDIKYILENPDVVKNSIIQRGVTADVDALCALYAERNKLIQALDEKRSQANRLAKAMPQASQDDKPRLIAEGRALNEAIADLEQTYRDKEAAYEAALMTIPNQLAEDTPSGGTDADNVVIKTHLSPRTFDFTPKDHLQLGKSLDLIDFDSGAKVTAAKFYFLKREAVLLELALKMFAMQRAMAEGYIPLITPDLAKQSMLNGAGFTPRGQESNHYHLEGLPLSLIGTAEITVAGMHADEWLDEGALPLKYVAESHCFRREAGASGQESKGLYRVHQFSKIELFQITTPETSEAAHLAILALEESLYQALGLPYRVVRICAGDLGAPAYKKYDIEVWMPGRESTEKYGEVTSASNCTDFQSRRLNIRYKNGDKQRVYPHTLNGTAIALSRVLVAILENYQQADGSVLIPEVLRPYIGFDVIKR